jgi:hypothetical protein
MNWLTWREKRVNQQPAVVLNAPANPPLPPGPHKPLHSTIATPPASPQGANRQPPNSWKLAYYTASAADKHLGDLESYQCEERPTWWPMHAVTPDSSVEMRAKQNTHGALTRTNMTAEVWRDATWRPDDDDKLTRANLEMRLASHPDAICDTPSIGISAAAAAAVQ